MSVVALTESPEPVPLTDLARTHAPIGAELERTFRRIVATGAFTLGDDLDRFEAEFAAYCGAGHCAGIANGTDALMLALLALGAGPGRQVVVPAQAFFATAEAVVATGAEPVFADIDPETRCVSPEAVAAAITGRTVAAIAVHLYGRPAPMPEIRAVCDAAGVPVLEDAAQAHGATIDGRRVGSLAAAAAFSFYPSKNLGALGDAGAVVSDDADLIARVKSLRHHGSVPGDSNRHLRFGGTHRLDNLQAALLRVKLPLLDDWNAQRRAAALEYRHVLTDQLVLPAEDAPGMQQVHHLFVVEVPGRDQVLDELRAAGIGAGVHYPTPVPLEPAFAGRFRAGDFPIARGLSDSALSLPLFPGITSDEIERVADVLLRSLGGRRMVA
jgi:dTDP-4-amino-4,6-dideoxygalactose transaminase